jgi:hypothetical protein
MPMAAYSPFESLARAAAPRGAEFPSGRPRPKDTAFQRADIEHLRALQMANNAREIGGRGAYEDPRTGASYAVNGEREPAARTGAAPPRSSTGYPPPPSASSSAPQTTILPPAEPSFDDDVQQIMRLFPQTPAAPVGHVAPVDTRGAEAESFARAKDQVGQTGAGAIASLRSVLGGRGLLGSGSESRGAASVINRGQGELGQVSRDQAIKRADMAADTAKFNYSGDVAQRGQDQQAERDRMSNMQAMLSLLRTSRPRRPASPSPAMSY